jgi:uncharacterized membrane protein
MNVSRLLKSGWQILGNDPMLQHLLTQQYYFTLKLAAILGCGLIAGVFFAFSSFIMTALARRPSAQGIAVMQSINIVVINPLFMLVFLGTGAVCLLLLVGAIGNWQLPNTPYLLVGSLLYLIGSLGVTIICNIPLNNELAVTQPNSNEAINIWTKYLARWTAWNHLRTIASLGAVVAFLLA